MNSEQVPQVYIYKIGVQNITAMDGSLDSYLDGRLRRYRLRVTERLAANTPTVVGWDGNDILFAPFPMVVKDGEIMPAHEAERSAA